MIVEDGRVWLNGEWLPLVTLDFESYYDKTYSLSKLTTEEYVRSELFEAIMVGVKIGAAQTVWVPQEKIERVLAVIDWSDKAVLCHNTVFDGFILSHHYGIHPRALLDTLSMARPWHAATTGLSLAALVKHYELGEKGREVVSALGKRRTDFTPEEYRAYGGYCANDVDLTYALLHVLAPLVSEKEVLTIDTTLKMYTRPVLRLNKVVLQQHYDDVIARKAALMQSLGLGTDEDHIRRVLMSNAMFAAVLSKLGVEPPMKKNAKGKDTFAFAKKDLQFTALLEHPNELVQGLVAARLGVKSTIEETRAQRLLGVADRGALPIMLNYYGAHTGRFSGGEKLNLQNFPRGGNLRRALEAPPGHTLIASDLSQIEARMVAYVAGQDDLVEAFREGRDVYSEFASVIYGHTVTKEDKIERFVGKTCILGLGYGMGGKKLQNTLEVGQGGVSALVSVPEATDYVTLYRRKNSHIARLWKVCDRMLRDMLLGVSGWINDWLYYDDTGIHLPNGMRLRYNALRRGEDGLEYLQDARAYKKYLAGADSDTLPWTKIYGGKATENLIQALAGIVIKEHMAAIGARYHVAFQVHDEIIVVVPDDEVDTARAWVEGVMSTAPEWAPELPVACESGVGKNYVEAK